MSESVALELTGDEVVVTAGELELGRYHFSPDAPAAEAPKPYWHPLRAMDGGLLTGYRPWDHRWHKGLQMTWTNVSGQNFWGGPTYVHGEGYVWRDNLGRMRHDGFTDLRTGGDDVGMTEQLTWITAAGETWLTETRTHGFPALDRERGYWVMDFSTVLRNVRGEDVRLGSPTTAGRPSAGYTGLFLRMPRAWTGGKVIGPAAVGTDALMGADTPWIAFSGQHDDVDGGGTVIAYAGSSTGSPPVKWFVRSEPFPVLAPSASFDEEIVLPDGHDVRLAHRHVFLDRIWDDDALTALATELAP